MRLTHVRTNHLQFLAGCLASCALAIAFVLGGTPAGAAQTLGTASSQKQKLTITLKNQPNPAKTGENNFEVTVKDAAGKPVTDADVALAFYMPAMPQMKMAEMKNNVPLKRETGGLYRGTGQVMMAGTWEVTVVVTRSGKEIGTQKLKLTAK
jgi:hypothetical protein